jgi:TP901 family phage tail tape measure protein
VAVSIPITTTFDRKGVEQAQAEMAKLSGAVNDTQKKISKQAKILGAAVGAAAIGIGVAGTMAFVDFERSMNEVFTLVPGTSQKAMDAMTNDVKNFAKEFGVLPDKVVPALYQALSAGVPSGNVFEFLEVAQKAAKGGVTDLTTAVNGISSVMNAYGAETVNATQASDLMFTAVRMGKTTFEEMSAALFQVTPTAAALGVKFGDVTAALASMTAQGVPTSVATTQLRQLFVELSKEGTKTSDVFEKISGKSFKKFVAEGGNTQQALQMLEKHAADTGVGVNDLFGSVEAGSAALSLTGKGTETFTKNLAEMGKSAGATEGAFNQMDQGLGPVIDKLKAFAAVLLIEIGTKIAPVIEKLVDFFDKNRVAAYALAGVVGGVLLVALAAYTVSDGCCFRCDDRSVCAIHCDRRRHWCNGCGCDLSLEELGPGLELGHGPQGLRSDHLDSRQRHHRAHCCTGCHYQVAAGQLGERLVSDSNRHQNRCLNNRDLLHGSH